MPRPPRVFILAYRIDANDARYLKLRDSFIAAGFETAAATPPPVAGKAHESVTVVAPRRAPAWLPRALAARFNAWAFAEALSAEGEAFRPDVIYVFDPEALRAAILLKVRSGAKLIYDAHEFHEEEDPGAPARGAWVKSTELRATPALDGFVTVNASIANLYHERRPGFPAALVVHNAVRAAPTPRDDGRLRRAANMAEGQRILLYQGGMGPMRGLDRLARAGALLGPDWMLVMMGSGALRGELEKIADPTRVRFLPPAPHAELGEWTAGAALGTIFYEDTGLNQHFCSPNKLWEYPAAGVPILASDLPEISRVVSGAGVGFLTPSHASAETIAQAVSAITPEALSAAAARCADFAATETWEREVKPLVGLIGALAQR